MRRALLTVFLVLTFTAWISAGESGKLTVTWLNIPVHGLTAVIETPSGKVHLIDTGGVKVGDADYNTARDAIVPFLTSRGHKAIESLTISHPHDDHYGAALWLMNNFTVREFVDHGYEWAKPFVHYTRLRGIAVQRGGTHRVVHSGDTLDWDPALTVEVLSPPTEFIDGGRDLNSNSVVLRVKHGENIFLFPGDAHGERIEKFLSANVAPEKLKSTVLSAPHHGWFPGREFPRMVMPKYVVASCMADYPENEKSPYTRSPGDLAMKIYGKLGAEVFVTGFHGNIQAVSDGTRVIFNKEHERIAPMLLEPPKYTRELQ